MPQAHEFLFRVWRVVLSVCLAAVPAIAQQAPSRQTALNESIEIARLLDLCAERLSLTIEYDTRVSGSATIRMSTELGDEQLWELTNRLLVSRGLTTVRMAEDETLSVVQLSSASGLARLVDAGAPSGAQLEVSPGFRSVRIPLRASTTDRMIEAVSPLLSTHGQATPLPELHTLIVADLSPRVALILQTVAVIEGSAANSAPVEIRLDQLPADRLITLISQITDSQSAAGLSTPRGQLLAGVGGGSVIVIAPSEDLDRWRELIRQFDRAESLETQVYSPGTVGLSDLASSVQSMIGSMEDDARIVADPLTNTLRVTARPAQHADIRDLLTRLSELPDAARRRTQTFRLKNRDAQDLIGVVQSVMGPSNPRVTSRPSDSEATDSQAPLGQRASTAPSLQLTADAATNSIIAIGEPLELDRLASLLLDLDVRRPQVLLEVLIVSLSESDSIDLGVEMEKLVIGPGDTIAKLSSLFGLSSTGAASSQIADRSSGGSAIVLSPGDFSVVLKALRAVNQGRSLSMPKVLVASNEQASLNSVLESPYATINASDTVATTAFGGSSPAGTEVSVTPQIAEGDHLRLEYNISLSAFVGEATDASLPPPRQQNSINSIATIPDGFTIAVGGIELITEGESETGIPLISDIPLVGEAFKNRSKSASRSRFFVFIRPTILRDRSFEDLKYLSESDVAEIGVDDGWPVQEPRIIR